jgi:hypothetical protein
VRRPDGEVIAFVDDIHDPVGQAHLQFDLGIGLRKTVQQGQQAVIGVQGADADTQQPARYPLCAGNRALGRGDLFQRLAALLPVQFALPGQADIARGPREQPAPPAAPRAT